MKQVKLCMVAVSDGLCDKAAVVGYGPPKTVDTGTILYCPIHWPKYKHEIEAQGRPIIWSVNLRKLILDD